jgi:hypothetical protein
VEDYTSDRGTSGLSLSPRGYVERISGSGETQLAIQKHRRYMAVGMRRRGRRMRILWDVGRGALRGEEVWESVGEVDGE